MKKLSNQSLVLWLQVLCCCLLQRAAVLKQPIPAAQAQTWLKLV
ncbi:MAG: hypothetical protein ACLTE2_04545 [Eubacteriales bacterium]